MLRLMDRSPGGEYSQLISGTTVSRRENWVPRMVFSPYACQESTTVTLRQLTPDHR